MKYIVKCPYCGRTYTVDGEGNEAAFVSDSCGAQNSIAQVVEKMNDLTQEERQYLRERRREDNLKKALAEELKDSEEFDFEAFHEKQKTEEMRPVLIMIAVYAVLAICMFILQNS